MTALEWSKLRPPPGIDMPCGGCNATFDGADGGILFAAQGSEKTGTGGIYLLPRAAPPNAVVTNYQGVDFNSLRDVILGPDGSVWFTDGTEGFEGDFRSRPNLAKCLYRYDPRNGDCKVMAVDLGRPRGLAFDAEGKTLFLIDAGGWEGGLKDVVRYVFHFAVLVSTMLVLRLMWLQAKCCVCIRRGTLFRIAISGQQAGLHIPSRQCTLLRENRPGR